MDDRTSNMDLGCSSSTFNTEGVPYSHVAMWEDKGLPVRGDKCFLFLS